MPVLEPTYNFIKKDSSTGVFLWNLRIFKNTYFDKNICERLLVLILSLFH